jgi:hypothetical protein
LAPNSLTVATTRNNIGSVLRDQGEHLEGCWAWSYGTKKACGNKLIAHPHNNSVYG